AHQGKQPAFALLDEWVRPAPPLPPDEALANLALRYFTSRGPATVQDFCWWSGLAVADARAGLGAVEGRLSVARLEGRSYYYAEATAAPGDEGERLRLLPPFDELLIAYRDRGAAIEPADMGRVVPGGNGVFNPIVVRDGRVVGTWRRALRAGRVELSFSPFRPWGEGEARAAAAEAERYGRFLGLPAVVASGA
ncbi:MAG TPA: winged helix DNA-binding domain-containing protein, partial [Chloroflexaceae bacterium]|nr:winged helix DNA-binding domain-containing protein [Chloroflexaceae bacterium]